MLALNEPKRKRGRPKGTNNVVYTVYDNKTDEIVCFELPADEAAKAIGMTTKTFRSTCTHSEMGINKRWTISKRKIKNIKNRYVTEVCPHCETEVTFAWDVEEFGYNAFCPVCGKRLMMCSQCCDNCDL